MKKGPRLRWPLTTCGRDSLVASLACTHRIGEIVQQSSCLYTCHLSNLNVCLAEPSQIVLSQVQSLKKAESFLRPLEAGTNSGYVAK